MKLFSEENWKYVIMSAAAIFLAAIYMETVTVKADAYKACVADTHQSLDCARAESVR